MLCFQCGSSVSEDALRCSNCGARLQNRSERVDLSSTGLERFTQKLKTGTPGRVAVGGESAASSGLLASGSVLAQRFDIGTRLGAGPFGEIYGALDCEIDAEVVVKVLRRELLDDPRIHARFLEATRQARQLTQRNVVRVHDSGVSDGRGWVSMQRLEGLTLDKVLRLRASKGEWFQAEELQPFVQQITLALQHVSRLYSHGDLKPENILFLPELIKLTDYYLFAALGPDLAVQALIHTNPYLAPELAVGRDEPDERADVYSLGMILSEMYFGTRQAPEAPQDAQAAAVAQLCRRAMHEDPTQRYPTVKALSEDFLFAVDAGALLLTAPPPTPPGAPPPTPPGAPMPPSAPPSFPEEEAFREPVGVDEPTVIRLGAEDLEALTLGGGGGHGVEDDLLTARVDRQDPATIEVPRTPPPPAGREPTVSTRASAGDARTAITVRPHPSRVSGQGRTTSFWILAVPVLVFAAILIAALITMGDDDEEAGGAEVVVRIGDEAPLPPAAPPTAVAVVDVPRPQPSRALAEVHHQVHATVSRALVAALADAGERVQVLVAEEARAEKLASGARRPITGARSVRGRARAAAATRQDDGQAALSKQASCPGDMVTSGSICIDTFEYPNRRGVEPRIKVSWFEARKACEASGKRLCKLSEWRDACGAKYPYGSSFDPSRCNTQDVDEFERSLVASGSFRRCRSRSGAHDMSGNVHEWVAEQKIAGGGFESDAEVSSCRYASPKSAGSKASYIGFRCCADPT